MSTDIIMPALSPTMEYGTLAKWLVKAGDHVKEGDIIAEIETDKATMELEVVEAGFISDILIPSGSEDIAVGTPLARLTDDAAQPAPQAAPIATPEAPTPKPVQEERPIANASAATQTLERPKVTFSDETAARLSPVAKQLAQRFNIDPDSVSGTGPNATVTRQDILSALPTDTVIEAGPAPVASTAPAPEALATTITGSTMSIECNVQKLICLKERINTIQALPDDAPITMDAIFARILGRAISQNADLNTPQLVVSLTGKSGTCTIDDPDKKGLASIQQDLDRAEATGSPNCRLENHSHLGIRQSIPACGPGEIIALSIGAFDAEPEPQSDTKPDASRAIITACFAGQLASSSTSAAIMSHIKKTIESPERLYL